MARGSRNIALLAILPRAKGFSASRLARKPGRREPALNPIAKPPVTDTPRFESTVQPLYDLNLQLLENAHLVCSWRVVTCQVNQADPSAPLVQARKLRFEAPDRLVLHPDEADHAEDAVSSTDPLLLDNLIAPEAVSATVRVPLHIGTWTLQRDPLLSRPYLDPSLTTGDTRALIMCLRRSKEGDDCDMTLYFQTGMEVQLECA